MTPKQKKVSLNAAVLRSIIGSQCLLRNAIYTMEEAANIKIDEAPKDFAKFSEMAVIMTKLRTVSDTLAALDPKFREYANFHPEPKWKRKFDKENSNAT